MQKRSIETRSRILDAALELFAQNGYDATSVAEICQAAKVSKGAFYHHFRTKQSIFLALLQSWLGTIDVMLDVNRQGAQAVPQALRQMSIIMTGVYDQAGGRLPMFLEFWTQASHDPLIWHEVIKPYQRYQQYFKSLIESGIAEGSLKAVDAGATAHTIVSLALGLLLQGLLDPHGAEWGKVTPTSIELLLAGIENKG
jgi:AcrR family transcriptional regulator